MRQIFNILITQGAGHTGHIASIVGARLGFKSFQGAHHIIEVLPCHFGDFVLAFELTQMAHGAQSFICLGYPFFNLVRVSFEVFTAEFLLREIICQLRLSMQLL